LLIGYKVFFYDNTKLAFVTFISSIACKNQQITHQKKAIVQTLK